jgi:hypothetical protein
VPPNDASENKLNVNPRLESCNRKQNRATGLYFLEQLYRGDWRSNTHKDTVTWRCCHKEYPPTSGSGRTAASERESRCLRKGKVCHTGAAQQEEALWRLSHCVPAFRAGVIIMHMMSSRVENRHQNNRGVISDDDASSLMTIHVSRQFQAVPFPDSDSGERTLYFDYFWALV